MPGAWEDHPWGDTVGLGASGWVNLPATTRASFSLLCDFVEESYRTVAPKKLVAQLDATRRPGSAVRGSPG